MNAVEPKVRDFCARSLDPARGQRLLRLHRRLGAQMPMRTIGYLLGIPESDQEAIRNRLDDGPGSTTARRRTSTWSSTAPRCSATTSDPTLIPNAIEELLARLEGRVALDEVLKRFPEWEVDWDHACRCARHDPRRSHAHLDGN